MVRLVNEYICGRLYRKEITRESTDVVIQNVLRNISFHAGGYKEMSILADLSLAMSPNAGGEWELQGSQPMNTAVHRSPSKLRRSNFILNL